MRWFRGNERGTAWLALLALAVQLAVSFGHVHVPDVHAGLTAGIAAGASTPADDPQHPGPDGCAVCAVIHLAGTLALPAPVVLAKVIGQSTAQLTKSGLPATAEQLGMTPYELLIVASLVQREALPHDFTKVARVIDNRLNEPQRLEFDSTVNYPLDRQEVATTDADRAKVTPWNTYASDGLPATPICSPGSEALRAAENPEPGDWLYFVTIDKDGTTLFTHSYQQHLNNIEMALDNGVLDSAR